MKKFARVLALMLVATMLCVMLVACGATPAEKPEDAKAALEANGYTATLVEAGGTTIVTGTASNFIDTVTITYYADEATAQAAYEALEAAASTLEEAYDLLDMKYSYGISGTMVWAGSADAVAAAK